jgi:uncharacterized glyoxalase superfamily protein PhnB
MFCAPFPVPLALRVGRQFKGGKQNHERETNHPSPLRYGNRTRLPFWVDVLGFTKTIDVPHGDKLGFIALQKESSEVMYQSFASIGEDMPLIAEAAKKGPTFLYIEVDNLDAVLTALKNSKIVEPERTAFYGMREVGYQDPTGHFITFAQRVAAAEKN